VDFVVCALAVKKKNQGRFRHVGSDHSLVSDEDGGIMKFNAMFEIDAVFSHG
jgi:hypothetical protein